MSEIMVIANPASGRGRGQHVISYVSKVLPEKGVRFDLVQTECPGHAAELARQAVSDGYRTIVALGGDGTVNEIINGLCLDLSDDPNPPAVVTLGIVPAGSGNDFAYAIGLPPTVPEALDRLVEGNTRLVDVGRINDRLFAYGVGMGFIAQANIESRKIKWMHGTLLYVIAFLKVLLFQFGTHELEITVDDTQIKQRVMLAAVANGGRTAGAFLLSPDARIDDGLLDLCIIAPASRLDVLRFMPLVLKGHHTKLDAVQTFTGREVKIRSGKPLVTHVDGEVFGRGERYYEFSLLPAQLRVIC
jgi:diacylglycerol kinase (ATP)